MTRLLVWIVMVLSTAACATGATGPARDVAGTWIGQCQSCPVRRFTLVLAQNGPELTGTLKASPRTGLGEAPMPLRDGKISGRSVSFSAQGADGVTFTATLRVSADDRRMDGHGSHRAGFPLSFARE